MIQINGTEVWLKCDVCGLTLFAGFNQTKSEIMMRFPSDGWTFDQQTMCPYCSEEAGKIKRAFPPRNAW